MKRTKMPAKSTKGQNLTSDYIPYSVAMRRGEELLRSPKKSVIGFYIILSVNSGLRVSDVLRITHGDLRGKEPGDTLRIQERKTKKYRDIKINKKIVDAYYTYTLQLRAEILSANRMNPNMIRTSGSGPIFVSQKGTVYHIASINHILKQEFSPLLPKLQISSHSLRKSFGRHVYESFGNSEDSLIILSEIFRHASLADTRRYLGIRQEEIDDIYMNL